MKRRNWADWYQKSIRVQEFNRVDLNEVVKLSWFLLGDNWFSEKMVEHTRNNPMTHFWTITKCKISQSKYYYFIIRDIVGPFFSREEAEILLCRDSHFLYQTHLDTVLKPQASRSYLHVLRWSLSLELAALYLVQCCSIVFITQPHPLSQIGEAPPAISTHVRLPVPTWTRMRIIYADQ